LEDCPWLPVQYVNFQTALPQRVDLEADLALVLNDMPLLTP
jgi:hypothetical protein